MSLDVVGYVIGGLFAFAAVVYTTWSTKRSKQDQDAVDKVRADGEAYARAMDINKDIVEGLRAEVDRLKAALAEVRTQLQTEEAHSDELDRKVTMLQLSVDLLSRLLTQHGIALPLGGAG